MARIWPTPGTRTGIHGGLGRELDVIELLPLAQTGDDYETSLPWKIHDEDLAMNLVARESSA